MSRLKPQSLCFRNNGNDKSDSVLGPDGAWVSRLLWWMEENRQQQMRGFFATLKMTALKVH